jgi:hypothetical protein
MFANGEAAPYQLVIVYGQYQEVASVNLQAYHTVHQCRSSMPQYM